MSIQFESQHDKTNKMTCVPSKDSDQPGHPPSLIRVFSLHGGSIGSLTTHKVQSEDSDQTGRMPRLTRAFTGCTWNFVGFIVRRLNYFPCNPFRQFPLKSISCAEQVVRGKFIHTENLQPGRNRSKSKLIEWRNWRFIKDLIKLF